MLHILFGIVPLILLLILLSKMIAIDKPSVIIVGAGASGIAAATKLLENGITNFKILEAEPRIGGRIYSIKNGESYVDLGAEWCHGEEGNIVYDIVKKLDLLEHSGLYKEAFLYSKKVIDQELGSELFAIMNTIYCEADENGNINQTLGDFCLKRYNKNIQDKYRNDTEKLEVAKDALDFFEHNVISNEGSFTWFDAICRSDFVDSAGDDALNWKDKGYRILLDVLMKKYPDPNKQLPIDDKILLNKEVVNISWNKNKLKKGIVIKCKDNTEFISDHVIFTTSIGVLKATADKLFTPTLPNIKMNAINNIGFDAVMKLIVYFPEKWWNHTDTILIWSNDDIRRASEDFNEGPKLNGRSWITHIFFLGWNSYSTNAMTVWLTGPLVPDTELLPHETLIRGVQFVLTKFMGNIPHFRKIDKIIPSQWYKNPHFRGTYSYQTLSTTLKTSGKSSEEVLAEPILNKKGWPLIQFAGEATHAIYYGTVHGAVETGYREANRLITLYKKM